MKKRCTWILVGATLLLGTPVFAGEGRIPVYAPTTITQNGKYFVTANITGDGSNPVITVQATNVDLDLNGFKLLQPTAGLAVILAGGGLDQLAIRNGTLSGGAIAIDARTLPGIKRLIVEDATAAGATSSGGAIQVDDGGQVILRHLVITGVSGSSALLLSNSSNGSTQGIIEDNLINGVSNGLRIQSGGGLGIVENSIDFGAGGSGFGILMDSCKGCQIRNNQISAQTYAIELDAGTGNVISGNTVDNTGGLTGIKLLDSTSFNVVSNNSVQGASGDGLRVQGSYNRIESNLLDNNSQWGLHLIGCQNTYGRNVSRGNSGSSCGGGSISYGSDFCDVCTPVTNRSFGDNDFANGLH